MLPANTGPADTPIPKSTIGSPRTDWAGLARGATAADPPPVQSQRGPEDRQRGVPLEFVDQPVVVVHGADDDAEKVVEYLSHFLRRPTRRQRRRADQIDEKDCR